MVCVPAARPISLLLLPLRPRLGIGRDGDADERLEGRGVDRLAFADVDGPAHIAVQAGIEQFLLSAPRRVQRIMRSKDLAEA